MLEFLVAIAVVSVIAATKHQQLRLIYAHVRRTFNHRRLNHQAGPYRHNPEALLELERARSKEAQARIEELETELAMARFERDIAKQRHSLAMLGERSRVGGAMALGALLSFTSFNLAPQITQDLAAATSSDHARTPRTRPREHMASHALLTMTSGYRLQYGCGALMCCHRQRTRLVAFGHLVYRLERLEPILPAIDFFWRTPSAEILMTATSGGEIPRPMPQEARPILVEHAEPSVDETHYAIATVALVVTLD